MLDTHSEEISHLYPEQKSAATIFLALLIGFLCGGFAFGLWTDQYPMIPQSTTAGAYPRPIIFTSLIASIGVSAFFVHFFRGRFTVTPAWGYAPFIFFFVGGPALSFFLNLAVAFNVLADYSPPRTYQTIVVDKGTTLANKGRRFWHVEVQDWRHSSDTVRLRVDREEYSAITARATVRMVTKPGALGYEWIVSRSIEAK